MTAPRLIVRYSIRQKGTPDLYDVFDEETGQYYGEPLPWDEALREKNRAIEAITTAETVGAAIWGWAAQIPSAP